MARLLSPYSGSGYTPRSTRVVSTVPGTTASYQAAELKAGREISAPVASSFGASIRRHPAASAQDIEPFGTSFGPGWGARALGRDAGSEECGKVVESWGCDSPDCARVCSGHDRSICG